MASLGCKTLNLGLATSNLGFCDVKFKAFDTKLWITNSKYGVINVKCGVVLTFNQKNNPFNLDDKRVTGVVSMVYAVGSSGGVLVVPVLLKNCDISLTLVSYPAVLVPALYWLYP